MKKSCINDYEDIRLIPIGKDDIENIRLLRNANKEYFFYAEEITVQEQIKWFDKYLNNENDYMFKVVKISNIYDIVGVVALYDFLPDIKQCEFGRIIIDHGKVSERGIGLKTTKCACQIAFDQLDVNRIVLEVYADNLRAFKTYLKAGFKEIRREYKSNDEREIIFMEILREW